MEIQEYLDRVEGKVKSLVKLKKINNQLTENNTKSL